MGGASKDPSPKGASRMDFEEVRMPTITTWGLTPCKSRPGKYEQGLVCRNNKYDWRITSRGPGGQAD